LSPRASAIAFASALASSGPGVRMSARAEITWLRVSFSSARALPDPSTHTVGDQLVDLGMLVREIQRDVTHQHPSS
jgi:hypothetical protein